MDFAYKMLEILQTSTPKKSHRVPPGDNFYKDVSMKTIYTSLYDIQNIGTTSLYQSLVL